MNPIESIEYKQHRINIYYDKDPINPRKEYDNLSIILYKKGTRYKLGDKEATPEEMEELYNDHKNISLPVYAYIHSGIAINTVGYGCPWDSGQSGIAYVPIEKAKECWPEASYDELKSNTEKAIKIEVETYSKYLSNECYYYETTKNNELVDSCSGYYSIEECIEAAKENV